MSEAYALRFSPKYNEGVSKILSKLTKNTWFAELVQKTGGGDYKEAKQAIEGIVQYGIFVMGSLAIREQVKIVNQSQPNPAMNTEPFKQPTPPHQEQLPSQKNEEEVIQPSSTFTVPVDAFLQSILETGSFHEEN